MKTKSMIVLAALIAITMGSLQKANAQDWHLTGNAGTNPGVNFLGTTDNKSLVFKTQGAERMRIGQGGNVRISNISGNVLSDVNLNIVGGTNAGLSGGGSIVAGSTTSQNVAIDVNGIMSRSNGAASALYLNEYGGNVYIDRNNTGSRLGIGTTAPLAPLHVKSTGTRVATFDGPNGMYIEVNENAAARGYLGSVAGNNADFELGTNSLNSTGKLHFTVKAIPKMTIDASGRVGIGITAPTVDAHIVHGSSSGTSHGLRIENVEANHNDWTFYTLNNGGELLLYANGTQKGIFDDVSGEYTPGSDARIKKDIEKVPAIMEKIVQLDVKKYHFLESKTDDKKYYGMIAQEVEKIFPEVVKHTYGDDGKDFYTMRYNALSVLAIKAIQEQQEKIKSQDKKIEELTKLVNRLVQNQPATSVSSSESNALTSKTINSIAALEQNTPNPFSSSTTIRYRVPAATANAQIMITNAAGSTVKTFTLTGKGAGAVTINGGELAAGTYHYSLIADGKKTDSKQMVLVK